MHKDDFSQQDFFGGSADFSSDGFNDDSFNLFDSNGDSSDDSSNDYFSQEQSSSEENFFDQQDDLMEQTSDSNNVFDQQPDTTYPEPHVHLSYKMVGIVVASAMIVIALIIGGLGKIKFVKSGNEEVQQPQQQQEVVVDEQVQESTTNNEVVTQAPNNTGFVEVPSTTRIDYSADIITSTGVVSNLKRYLQDGQVIYCIDIDLTLGTQTCTVHYYCGYNTYSQVGVGDVLTVEYQQVSDNCFSVRTITK